MWPIMWFRGNVRYPCRKLMQRNQRNPLTYVVKETTNLCLALRFTLYDYFILNVKYIYVSNIYQVQHEVT